MTWRQRALAPALVETASARPCAPHSRSHRPFRESSTFHQRPRWPAQTVLEPTAHGLLSQRALRYLRRRPWVPHGVRRSLGRVSRLQPRGWKRPLHADARLRFPRLTPRRPLVRVRRAVARGARRRSSCSGLTCGDARPFARNRAARPAAKTRHRLMAATLSR